VIKIILVNLKIIKIKEIKKKIKIKIISLNKRKKLRKKL